MTDLPETHPPDSEDSDTSPGIPGIPLRFLHSEYNELELRVEVPPKANAMAWGFAEWMFRVDSVEWSGPALVNWLGSWHVSPSFAPREETRRGPKPRVHVLGDPIGFVVINPTDEPLEVVLLVRGKSV